VQELQAIGDQQILARLEQVAPQLEPWMRTAVAVYAGWERQVAALNEQRDAVGKRTEDEKQENYSLSQVGLPDEFMAHTMVDEVVAKQAGSTARMNEIGTPLGMARSITEVEGATSPSGKSPKSSSGSPKGKPATPAHKSSLLAPEIVAMNEQTLALLTSQVQAREAEMKHMTKNVSRILQHKLVYPQENGGNLSFDDAERLLAALSSKDSARQELKVLQKEVMAMRPAEDARKTFHVKKDQLLSIRDLLGYLRQAKSLGDPLYPAHPASPSASSRPGSSWRDLARPKSSASQSPVSPVRRTGTPASPTNPMSPPASPTPGRRQQPVKLGFF
jgi:hypothetical protein